MQDIMPYTMYINSPFICFLMPYMWPMFMGGCVIFLATLYRYHCHWIYSILVFINGLFIIIPASVAQTHTMLDVGITIGLMAFVLYWLLLVTLPFLGDKEEKNREI